MAAIAVVAAFLDDGDRATGRAATDDAATSTRSTPEGLPDQLAVLDDSGQFVTTLTLPQGVPQISSIALSPDGRWAAVASRRSVILFQPSRQPGRVFQLPFEAVDLEWRGP